MSWLGPIAGWLAGLAPALLALTMTFWGVVPAPSGYILATLLLVPVFLIAERVCGWIERRIYAGPE